MTITANGQPVEIPREMTVAELLTETRVQMPEYVTVQLDGEILKRAAFDTTTVKDGAVVEYLYYMGGGSGPRRVSKTRPRGRREWAAYRNLPGRRRLGNR
jgi:sulfur carrier protein